jgi:hypothetical protein
MIKIYEPLNEEGYELCHPIDDSDFFTIAELCNGAALAKTWKPLEMKLVRVDYGKQLRESDSPWLESSILIVRPRVIWALGPLLRTYGELLPLNCVGAELWLYNVTRVIDALDEAASTIRRLRDGRATLIARPAFHKEAIENNDVFKISRPKRHSIYCSQHFVDLWRAAGLTGLEFKHVWSG